jgi:hypothetical protein
LLGSFQKLLRNAFGFLWLSIFGVGIAYVLSSLFVTSLFGERYRGGEPVVAGLALYACAMLWFELMKTFAMSRNRHHSLVVARATQMAFSLILIYPLTQLAGLSGAGFTTGIAALAMACVATVFVRQVVLEEAVKRRKDAAIQPEPSERHSRMSEYWLVPVRPYLIAGLMGIVTISLRLAMDPVFGPYYNFSPLLLGLMHIAWNYGLRPSQAYFGLTLAGSVYFFIPPRGEWLVTTTVDVLALACYVVFAVIVMMFVEHKRRTRPSPQGAGLSLGAEPNEQVQAKGLPRRERGHLKAVND